MAHLLGDANITERCRSKLRGSIFTAKTMYVRNYWISSINWRYRSLNVSLLFMMVKKNKKPLRAGGNGQTKFEK